MKPSFKIKALAGAMLLSVGGSAFANTALETTSSGSIFLNLWDQTAGTSFTYDTGLNQSTFNGDTTVFNANVAAGNTNYSSFLASLAGGSLSGGDTITYSVVSATTNGAFTTSLAPPGSVFNAKLGSGNTALGNFAQNVNGITTTSTNSAFAPSGSLAVWGTADGPWNTNLKVNADSSVGSALNFYSLAFGAGSHSSNTIKATLVTFAGTWLLDSAGNLSYSSGVASVPVPASFGLLLAGLALMGVIARRGKTAAGDRDFGGAAA